MKRFLVVSCVCILALTSTRAPLTAGDWPQWRGPDRNGVSKESGLLPEWPQEGPALRWKIGDIGTGYSSPSVAQGRVYLQTTGGAEEYALSRDEKDGAEIWKVPIGKVGQNRGPQYPGTRSTPTIDGDRIYCLASDGELACLQRADGKAIWSKNLARDFDGKPGQWAYTESVLVDGNIVVCTPGGESASLVALDKLTGETIWKSPIPQAGTAEYASIIVVGQGNTKEYVQFLRSGLVGVDAKTGKLLWRYAKTADQAANIVTPVSLGDRIFSASRAGGAVVELKTADGNVTANELYLDLKLAAGVGGVVAIDGNLFGAGGQSMFCADFASGTIKWSDRALGAASVAFADGRLYVRGHKTGEVALVEPASEGYREKGRFQQPDRSKSDAWPHPVIANGGLYLRDQGQLFCYNVKAAAVAATLQR